MLFVYKTYLRDVIVMLTPIQQLHLGVQWFLSDFRTTVIKVKLLITKLHP